MRLLRKSAVGLTMISSHVRRPDGGQFQERLSTSALHRVAIVCSAQIGHLLAVLEPSNAWHRDAVDTTRKHSDIADDCTDILRIKRERVVDICASKDNKKVSYRRGVLPAKRASTGRGNNSLPVNLQTCANRKLPCKTQHVLTCHVLCSNRYETDNFEPLLNKRVS